MENAYTLNYNYRVKYANGKGYDSRNRNFIAACDVSREEYIAFVKYIAAGGELNADGLDDTVGAVVAKMKALVDENDRFYSMDGYLLPKALKKKRSIDKIEIWPDEMDIRRFQKIKDIEGTFSRPSQTLVLNRFDGSTVTITVENGKAEVSDSRKNNQRMIVDEDTLANTIARW